MKLLSIGFSSTGSLAGDIVIAVISVIFGGLFLVILIGYARRGIRDHLGKARSAAATVIDKYDTTYSGAGKYGYYVNKDCILTFDVGGRTVKFLVTPLEYDCVEKGQKGILEYRGSKYIDFNETGGAHRNETENPCWEKKYYHFYRKKG